MSDALICLGVFVAFWAVWWLLDLPVNEDGLGAREYWRQCPLWHDSAGGGK